MTAPVSEIDICIVVPAFNEARRLPSSLQAITNFLATTRLTWEVRVVDDGSTDDTAAVVATAAAVEPRVVLQREPHRGKGGAVRAGMLAATARRRFLCDADLSMPIEELERFLVQVPNRADIAIGSREGDGAKRVGEPAERHSMGRAFNTLVRSLILRDFQDTQCGFKLFSAEAAEAIFARVTITGWAFDVEALFLAKQLGLNVVVVPITWHYADESRVAPIADALRMARDVAGIRWRAVRGGYRLSRPPLD